MTSADMQNPPPPPAGPALHRFVSAAALLLLISCALTPNNAPQAPPPPEQDIDSSPPRPGTPPLEPPPVSPAPAARSPETPVPAPPAPETPALASRALETPAPAPELPSPETPAPASPVPEIPAPAGSSPDPLGLSPARPPVQVNLFKRPPDSSAPFKEKTRKSEPASPKEPKRTHPRKIREPSLDFSRLNAAPVQVPINPLKEPDIPLYPSVPSADLQTPVEPPNPSAGNPAPAPPGSPPNTSPPSTSPLSTSPLSTSPLSPPPPSTPPPDTSPPPVPPVPASPSSPARPGHPALSAEAPERHLDAPGTFTVTLKGQGWVFRSDLAEPGAWTYLEREREGDSTRFHFRVDQEGAWNLVFDRQDLSGGGVERTVRRIRAGGPNAPLASLDESPPLKFDTPREAVAAGRFEDAFALWEENAGRSGPEGRAARENIVRQASLLGTMAPLIKWLTPYIQDGPDPLIMETVLERLTNTVGYQEQTVSVLEALLARERRDEWLYRLAFLLEQPGDRRDIDRAAQLYRELVESRTLSIWRDRAEERISRLERHYYRVR